ncbi:MAG: hypothetical protein RPT25_09370 [Cycloclasticus sp.]
MRHYSNILLANTHPAELVVMLSAINHNQKRAWLSLAVTNLKNKAAQAGAT